MRAFDDFKIKPFWPKEYFDDKLPKDKGFISDYVLSTRGTEVSTIYNVWCALFCISSVLKRDAWLKWFPNRLFSNMYLVLVGPPGISHKSTAVFLVEDILSNYHKRIKNHNMQRIKTLRFVKNKATPEAILDQMIPPKTGGGGFRLTDANGEYLIGRDKKPKKYMNTSEVVLLLTELSSMMNKASYMETLIGDLLDLYDPRDEWEWSTAKRGKVYLKNVYTNLIGATTESSLRETIPKSVRGDGFLSRTFLVPCVDYARRYPQPIPVIGGPQKSDLELELAWIAENIVGEYTLSKEASEFQREWYHSYRDKIDQKPSEVGVASRRPTHILKIAFLLSAQRFNTTREISLQDLQDAITIVEETASHTPILLSNISSGDYNKNYDIVKNYLMRSYETQRRKLLQSSTLTSVQINIILKELVASGFIEIYKDGFKRERPSPFGKEVYRYVGERPDF